MTPREDAVVVEGGTDRPPLDEQIARHVLEVPERHSPPTPHCDYCWEEWPCTVELMRHEADRLRRVEAAAREEVRTRDIAREIAGRHVAAGHAYTDSMPDLEAATVVATTAEEALRDALSEPVA